ncbi:MAG: RraA family protein [Balneolaceae bacterium]|nr:MAG: RraA family protein [Balneolaceae bacterium]
MNGRLRLIVCAAMLFFIGYAQVYAQPQLTTKENLEFITAEWKGERDEFGRPFVADDILERLRFVGLEEAWAVLRSTGYHNKFEGDWQIIWPEKVMVGRALTAAFLPSNPELAERMNEAGREQGLQGAANQWPIYMLQKGDVYVADGFGKIKEGTLIGNNLGQAIYANSGNGPVFYGSARDLSGLREIEGFNAWVKGWHPSYIMNMMLISINGPIRIGDAVVLPGDVVLATEGGVLFIPPHLAENVIVSSEVERLTDAFRQQRILEGVYSLSETYGTRWTDTIENDFYRWLEQNLERLATEFGVAVETANKVFTNRSRNWREWVD